MFRIIKKIYSTNNFSFPFNPFYKYKILKKSLAHGKRRISPLGSVFSMIREKISSLSYNKNKPGVFF